MNDEPRVPWGMILLTAALALTLLAIAFGARADVQPDPRPIQWYNCNLGGASAGASQVATGGTAVTVAVGSSPPGAPLRGIVIQNPSTATESLFVEITGAAAGENAGQSIELIAGALMSEGPGTIGNKAVSINAASNGHQFVCKYGQ